MPRVEKSDSLVGRVLDGRFRIERTLGSGGMGVVYLAQQLNVGRDVAVKVLRPDRLGDRKAMARFETEAKAISRLRSPHTVTLVDFGSTAEGAYLVMEYLEGATLRAEMAARRLSTTEAVRILDQVALSIAEAHACGIVHGDIKPGNVLLARAERHLEFAKVVDFGLAAIVGERDESHASVAGTPRYIAPERLGGDPADARSDVYALGVMAYEMLAGVHPFPRSTKREALAAHLGGEATPLRDLAPDVPEECDKLVRRAMAQDPRLRFRDAGAFRSALRIAFTLEAEVVSSTTRQPIDPGDTTTFLSTQTLGIRRSRIPMEGRRRWLLAAAVAAGAGLVWTTTANDAPPGTLSQSLRSSTADTRRAAEPAPPVQPPPAAPSAAPAEPAPLEPVRQKHGSAFKQKVSSYLD